MQQQYYNQKAIIGIDLGSSKSTISQISKNGFGSIQSEASNVEIPSLYSYDEKGRYVFICISRPLQFISIRNFSDHALAVIKRNYKNSFINIIYLLNKNEQNSHFLLQNGKIDGQKIYFTVNYLDNEIDLIPEQIMAGFLSGLDALIQQKLTHDSFISVLSIPPCFTFNEYQSLKISSQISKFGNVKIISEHVALGYAYLWAQKHELNTKENEHNVVFIDMGYTKTNIFAASFNKERCTIRYVDCIKQGVRDIDFGIFQILKQQFEEQIGQYPEDNKKVFLRIMDCIEKGRKILSTNPDVQLVCECIYMEKDLNYNLTREVLETVVLNNFLTIFSSQMRKCQEFLVHDSFNINDIEIMGGGLRIPVFKRIIQESFQTEKLGQALGIESISRGCAIQSALVLSTLSSNIKIEQYVVRNILSRDIRIMGGGLQDTITAGTALPIQHNYLIQSTLNEFSIEVYFGVELSLRFNFMKVFQGVQMLIIFDIQDDYNIKIQDTSYPVVEGEEQKEDTSNFTTECINQLDQVYLEDLVKQENEMKKNDKVKLAIMDKKNDLEKKIYENSILIEEKLKIIIEENVIMELQKKLQNIKQWFEEEQEGCGLEQLEAQLQCITLLMSPYTDIINERQYECIQVNTIDQLSQVRDKFKGKQISYFSLSLRNQNVYDGGDFMHFFSKKGAYKVAHILRDIQVSSRLDVDLGNNSLTDKGVKYIFEALSGAGYQSLKELKIDLESKNTNWKIKNNLTNQSVLSVLQLFEKLHSLENIQFCVNTLNVGELQQLEKVLLQKKNLKYIKLQIKDGEINNQARKKFMQSVQGLQGLIKFELEYYNSKGNKEDID